MNEKRWAYLAGLFDGDGCITVAKSKKPRTRYYLAVAFTSTHLKTLEFLHENFGGSLYVDKRNYRKLKYKVGQWIIGSNKARDFLQRLLPYSIIKKKQIKLAIKFQNSLEERHKKQKLRFMPLSDEETLFRENLVKKMRKAKADGRELCVK